MSILTDTDLKKIICRKESEWDQENQLLIEEYSEECLTPMGYDLRVGGFYKTFLAKPPLTTISRDEQVTIKPGDIALIGTLEKIKMPKNGSISALILSRVSQVSRGLSHISTKVDPGWAEGELLIPVQNFSRNNLYLDYEEKFCTIVFFKNESPPVSGYDSGSSRAKLVKLLAQTSRDSLSKEITLASISMLIIGISVGVGYFFFKDKPTFGPIVVAGLAVERVVLGVASRLIGRR